MWQHCTTLTGPGAGNLHYTQLKKVRSHLSRDSIGAQRWKFLDFVVFVSPDALISTTTKHDTPRPATHTNIVLCVHIRRSRCPKRSDWYVCIICEFMADTHTITGGVMDNEQWKPYARQNGLPVQLTS